jgi:hypothetical protein
MKVNLPVLSQAEIGRPVYRKRNPILEGKLYQFRQAEWDYYGVTVNTAVTKQSLFQIQQGGGYTPAGGAAITKTNWHTSMLAAGQLPNPEKLFIKAVQLSIRHDTLLADSRWLYDVLLSLFIGGTRITYLQAHGFKLPAAGGLTGLSSGIVANGVQDTRNQFMLWGDLGEVVEQLQNLRVDLDPTLVSDAAGNTTLTTATAANGGTGINAFVYLDGLLNREVA